MLKFVGINSGLLGGEREGVTHQFYEDIGILSNIPNFTILTPADAAQTYHAVKVALEIEGPVYVRAGSGREPDVYEKDVPFTMDGIRVLKEYGNDALLCSSGFVLNRVLKAAELLKEQGINVTVADINIINAANPEKVIAEIKKGKENCDSRGSQHSRRSWSLYQQTGCRERSKTGRAYWINYIR